MEPEVNNSMEPFFDVPKQFLLEEMKNIENSSVESNECLEILNEIIHEDMGINPFDTDSNRYIKIKFARIDYVNLKIEFHCIWVRMPVFIKNTTLTTELPFLENAKFIELSLWAKVGTDTFIPLTSITQIEFNQKQQFNLVFLNTTQDGETSGVLKEAHSALETSITHVVTNKLKYAEIVTTDMVVTRMENESQVKCCIQFKRSTDLPKLDTETIELEKEKESERNKRLVVPFTMQLRPRKNTYLIPTCRYCASASSAYRERIDELYRKEEMIITLNESLHFDKMGVGEEYYNPKNIIPTVILRKGRKFNPNCTLCIYKSILKVPIKRIYKRSTKKNLNKRVKLSSSPTLTIKSIQEKSEPLLVNSSNSEVPSIDSNLEDNSVIKRVKRGRPRTRGKKQLKNGKRLLQAHNITDNVTRAAKRAAPSRSLLKRTVASITQNIEKTVQNSGPVVIPNIASNISTIECSYNGKIQNIEQNFETLQIENTTEDKMENDISISENFSDSSPICVKDLQKKLTEITIKTIFAPVKKSIPYQALRSEEKKLKEAEKRVKTNKEEQSKYSPWNVSTISDDQNTYEMYSKKNIAEHISIDSTNTDTNSKINSMQNGSIFSTQPISAVATTQNVVPKFLENLTVINSTPSVKAQQVVKNNASISKRPCTYTPKVSNKKNKSYSNKHEIASILASKNPQRITATESSTQSKKGPIFISVTPVSGQQCKLPAKNCMQTKPLVSISPINSTISIEHNDSQLGKKNKLKSTTTVTRVKAVPRLSKSSTLSYSKRTKH
ncbi:uncharacterized protein LOC119687970 [Teleopsis dalmanni]|uniref:uncharacterized protein LOC119687970 n=1 Tax=Teleopsis dalmanni TaxID=139649 RepID=UPI0018CD1F8D|nr:uncharacterized protein LOC119687970 [Teleopsis dalmanni]